MQCLASKPLLGLGEHRTWKNRLERQLLQRLWGSTAVSQVWVAHLYCAKLNQYRSYLEFRFKCQFWAGSVSSRQTFLFLGKDLAVLQACFCLLQINFHAFLINPSIMVAGQKNIGFQVVFFSMHNCPGASAGLVSQIMAVTGRKWWTSFIKAIGWILSVIKCLCWLWVNDMNL